MEPLKLTSPAFREGCLIPKRHTGFGEDLSPTLCLSGLCEEVVSLAVVLEDLDVPFCKPYCHWLIWNLPPVAEIPEGVPHGPSVLSLGNAVQGVGYGSHQYRGPYPPPFLRSAHRYVFRAYALDCTLDLPSATRRRTLVKAMSGHILQEASLSGIFRRP